MSAYLLPISDREPLAWILEESRTAFPAYRRREAASLAAGDMLFLYTTRGCFRNPTRDRGRVVGIATVAGPAVDLGTPVRFGDREFPVGVKMEIEILVPRGGGVELGPLIPRLAESFPNERAWSARLRRALVPLTGRDAKTLEKELRRVRAGAVREAAKTYVLPDGQSRS